MTDHIYTKATCTKCRANFNMRIERDDKAFVCEKCGAWQQAKFPCPLCKGQTVHSVREGNEWVPLQDSKHEHPEPEPELEPEPEPDTTEEVAKK